MTNPSRFCCRKRWWTWWQWQPECYVCKAYSQFTTNDKATLGFLLTGLFFPRDKPRIVRVSQGLQRTTFTDFRSWNFYTLDAISVAQPTVFKHWRSSRSHGALKQISVCRPTAERSSRNPRRLRGMTSDTHEAGGQIDGEVRLVGVDLASINIPHAQHRLVSAPVLVI